ncbi:MAG: ComEC/Rec2 family competence protein, partial [Clostridia bacterium]|nr:ComEC/Rec2 family competence protein [Clostridia bacterium]
MLILQMKKFNFRFLFYPFLIFLLGLNVVRYIFNGEIEYIIICGVLIGLLVTYCIIRKHFKQMIVLLICFVVGCGWYFVGVSLSFNQQVYVGKVAVVGRVTDSISEEKYSYTIILDDVKINGESGDNISVRVTNCYDLPQVGSFISFESELENVHAFTLGNFNTSCYRSGVRYYADCNFKYAVVTEGYQLFDEQVRLRVKGMLEQNMSYENAQTAYASLFGDKNNLDGDVYANYNGAGILHILTVSGLHISFLISLIFGLLELCRVNKYVNFVVTTVFIIFYAYLCNWTPSVLRAGIMGIVFMLSKLLHRKYDSLNALGLAGFIICLTRPLSGLDVGFLMSVFCVIGINMVMPIIKRALIKILPKGMSEALAISIAAQIGIFPIVCLIGGGFNVLSLF